MTTMVKSDWTQLELAFAAPRDVDWNTFSENSAHDASEAFRESVLREAKPAKGNLHTAGRYFDLKDVLERVSTRYFDGPMDIRIEWGRSLRKKRSRRRRPSSRSLALYYFDTNTIRVSPVLDAENVPSFVIDWVVYHECLHHVLPVRSSSGRNIYHSREFRALERAFDHYEEALAWEANHIDQLLR